MLGHRLVYVRSSIICPLALLSQYITVDIKPYDRSLGILTFINTTTMLMNTDFTKVEAVKEISPQYGFAMGSTTKSLKRNTNVKAYPLVERYKYSSSFSPH